MTHPLTGTPSLVRLVLRRDRIRLSIWILAILGIVYFSTAAVPDVYGSPEAIRGYVVSSSIMVGLLFVACVVSVAFCSLTKDTTLKMAAELAERRKKAGVPF